MATVQENPLVEGLERLPVPATTLVIFGVTGDLAGRKLLPALYDLAHEGSLPDHLHLIGFARRDLTDEAFRDRVAAAVTDHARHRPDRDVLAALLERVSYVSGSFDDPGAYERLERTAEAADQAEGVISNRVFYLSTAPGFFSVIVSALRARHLERLQGADVRIVIEKPFGTDLGSARTLNRSVLDAFEERQVFRIDHYLGKETVQNMMAFRFANGLFEPLWNRNYIDYVQITAAEDIGIGSRGAYYDSSGALRDLVQNHMIQLLSLLAMEPPASFAADKVRDEKVKVMEAIDPPAPDEVGDMAVRAQYGPGTLGGDAVPGYLEEEGVDPESTTETYAALRLEVSNWRWAGVPFYLRTGKRLARKLTEIAVTLKPVPHLAFGYDGPAGIQPNTLVLAVQPDEGVSISLGAKIPGSGMRIRPVNMEFRYGTSFLSESPEAYERLILDVMRGDATLFARADEVDASWAICDPILAHWGDERRMLPQYPPASQGPAESDRMLRGSAAWRSL